MLYFLYPFIVGFILSYAWGRVKPLFAQGTAAARGMRFGALACLFFVLPGMFVTYSSFAVSFVMVLVWTASGIVSMLIAGAILAKTNP